MSSLTIIQKGNLSETEYAQVVDLCSRAFEADYAHIMRTFAAPIHLLGYLDGDLVSHALWVTRSLEYDNNLLLNTAYIEGVVTDPAWQRCGFGTTMMRALQASITAFELAALSAEHIAWYERLGWELWQGPLYVRAAGEKQPTPRDDVMILRLPGTPPLDVHKSLSAEWRPGDFW